ncbi:MAG: SemiSWEET transporter [Thermodesulfobacteriota bacterium]
MTLITLLGLVAALCTTLSFLPQAIKIIKTKETGSISLLMYILLDCGLFLWFVYGILIKSFPLILANGVAFLLSSIVLVLKVVYER